MTTTTTTLPSLAPEGRLFAAVELRDVSTTESFSMLEGRAVPYGEWANIGWFLEEFAAGSLAKSIKEAARDLPLNLFHDNQSFPIAAARKWTERGDGLWGQWALDSSELAQEAARHAQEGRLTGLSIEFIPIRSTWEFTEDWDPSAGPGGMDKVTREEARLCAVGLVQSPAYVSAGVQLVRSADARRRVEEQRAAGTPVLDAVKARTEALRAGR